MIRKLFSTIKGWWIKWKDPTRTLERQYNKLLREARDLQRKGDIPAFAKKTREGEELRKKIEQFRK